MTESTPFFDGPSEPEAPASKRKVALAGGLVAALLLAGGGYFFLSGGETDDVVYAAPKAPTKRAVPAKPKASTVKKPVVKKPAPVKVPAASTVKLGRDPFLALYVQPVAAAVVAPTTTTPTSTTPTSTGTTTGTTPTANKPYALKLMSVSASTTEAKVYTFSVDGTTKSVIAAQRFGKYGELVVLTFIKNSAGKAIGAVVQVGDDNPLEISLGEKITVL